MSAQPRTVLVMEQSKETRGRFGRWLEDAGVDELTCPGPTGPDYRCLGRRGLPCPLVRGADAIVLDLWLESDLGMEGTSALDLLAHYLDSGLPVVALTHSELSVSSPGERRELVETVRALLGGRS